MIRVWMVLVLVVALVALGVRWQIDRQTARDAADYRDAIERMQDANDLDRSPDAVIDRLRGHATSR